MASRDGDGSRLPSGDRVRNCWSSGFSLRDFTLLASCIMSGAGATRSHAICARRQAPQA